MANYAEIRISAHVTSNGIVSPGVTVKFNVFTGGIVQYRSFISSYNQNLPDNFSTMARLGQMVASLNPAYTYSASSAYAFEGGPRIDTVTIKATQYSNNFNFGAFYTSDSAKIFLQAKLDNVPPAAESVTISRVDVTQEVNGQGNGKAIIIAYSTPAGMALEYSINSTDYFISSTFSNLSAGNYTAHVRLRDNPAVTDSEPFEVENVISPLSASYTKKDVNVAGGSDGEINVTVNEGSGSYTYLWNDGVTTQDRTGLSGGNYSVEITDTVTGETFLIYVTIYEPEEIPKNPPYLYVPDLNSIRYVREDAIDFEDTFPIPENTLFADSKEPGITQANYCQKVSQSDNVTIQLQSNYDSNVLTLKSSTGAEVLRVPFIKRLTLSGIEEEYTGDAGLAYFKGPAVGSTDTTYIYPNAEEFQIGNVVVISDNVHFNGTYTILSSGYNPFFKRNYVEINTPIESGAGWDLSVTVKFIIDLRPYDVYEASIDFGLFETGRYQSIIEAADDDYGFKRLLSEPLNLLSSLDDYWKKSLCIDYWNEDNAFNLAYQTGLKNKIRVEGRFFKIVPGGDTSVLRQPNGDLVKVTGKAYRGRMVETYKMPTWMHEKLSAIFQHDFIFINGQECQTDEEYEVEYFDYTPFVNGSINVEVLGWFDKGNGHDPGNGSQETGLIIANEGFLLR